MGGLAASTCRSISVGSSKARLSASETASKTNKTDKGLRHFSAKVCGKVEEKGCTTYNEVADELVQEIGLELGVFEHDLFLMI